MAVLSEPVAAVEETVCLSVAAGELRVPLQQVGRYAGGTDYRLAERLEGLASAALTRARDLAQPRLAYAAHPVVASEVGRGLELADGEWVWAPTRVLASRPPLLVAAVCTLGEAIDQEAKTLTQGRSMTEGLFLDAAGVALVEALGQHCRQVLAQAAGQRGLYCGCPFGPGVGGMALSAGPQLFAHLNAQAIGVSCNPRGGMRPLKSTAIWVPWTDQAPRPGDETYKCQRCDLPTCQYRLTPYLPA